MSETTRDTIADPIVFRQVFSEHAQSLRNLIYYKSGNLQLAEDLVQEAFLRLWKRRHDVSPEKARSFLFTTGNRLFLDNVRHQQVVFKFQQVPRTDRDNQSPQYQLEEEEFNQQLQAALGRLPETIREVFLLNRVEKKPYREIAEILGVSIKTVEKRMSKALMALRKLSPQI